MITIVLLPLVFTVGTWWRYQRDTKSLEPKRKFLFLIGIIGSTVSAVVLAAFVINAYVVSLGTKPADLDRAYPVFSMLGLGLVAAMLGASGRGVSRVFLIANGLLLTVSWYLAAMGASP